jgi:HSP20 family protein
MTHAILRPVVRTRNSEFANLANHVFAKPSKNQISEVKSSGTPAFANIQQLDDKFIIQLAVPGFTKEEINISLEEYTIKVTGKKEALENISFLRKEFDLTTFERKFALSKDIDIQNIEATTVNGILQITLNKVPQKAPINIEVK